MRWIDRLISLALICVVGVNLGVAMALTKVRQIKPVVWPHAACI